MVGCPRVVLGEAAQMLPFMFVSLVHWIES